MLLAGDECGRTQLGNNNAYCQDNEITWHDWSLSDEDQNLLTFARELIHLRKSHRTFRRRRFFQNRSIRGDHVSDIIWFDPSGSEMSDQQWSESNARTLGVFLSGRSLQEEDERGQLLVDSDFLMLVNAHHEPVEFRIPTELSDRHWLLRLDTADPAGFGIERRTLRPGDSYVIEGRALALFEHPLQQEDNV